MEVTQELAKGDCVCPIVSSENDSGGMNHVAYIIGPVSEIAHYAALVDILNCATENDVVVINIDSPGGLVTTGAMVASAIHHSKAQVYTEAKGFCASAAALIHSSAKKECIHASPFSVMMYHTSSGADMGYTTRVAHSASNMVRYVNESLLSKAFELGHITQEEFDRIQSGDEIFIPGNEFNRRNQGSQPAKYEDKGEELDITAGTESYDVVSWYGKVNKAPITDTLEATMDRPMAGPKPAKPSHYIYTRDKKDYRIYLRPDIVFSPTEVRMLCKFLDSLNSDNSVTIYLGGDGDDSASYLVGAVLDSWVRCLAKTTAVASGLCSAADTMIWCYAKERRVQRYGSLRFEVNVTFTRHRPSWLEYYKLFLDKGKELGVLTDTDAEYVVSTGNSKMLLYSDLERFH